MIFIFSALATSIAPIVESNRDTKVLCKNVFRISFHLCSIVCVICQMCSILRWNSNSNEENNSMSYQNITFFFSFSRQKNEKKEWNAQVIGKIIYCTFFVRWNVLNHTKCCLSQLCSMSLYWVTMVCLCFFLSSVSVALKQYFNISFYAKKRVNQKTHRTNIKWQMKRVESKHALSSAFALDSWIQYWMELLKQLFCVCARSPPTSKHLSKANVLFFYS